MSVQTRGIFLLIKSALTGEKYPLPEGFDLAQCKELMAQGVPSIHFYTVSAVDSIAEIARRIY